MGRYCKKCSCTVSSVEESWRAMQSVYSLKDGTLVQDVFRCLVCSRVTVHSTDYLSLSSKDGTSLQGVFCRSVYSRVTVYRIAELTH